MAALADYLVKIKAMIQITLFSYVYNELTSTTISATLVVRWLSLLQVMMTSFYTWKFNCCIETILVDRKKMNVVSFIICQHAVDSCNILIGRTCNVKSKTKSSITTMKCVLCQETYALATILTRCIGTIMYKLASHLIHRKSSVIKHNAGL